ncbi:DoxX family protein [Cytophagaceae bacterium ABcell3]|nr:DoxX family protein [Cytophagaceae bacterium ABcell3]
MRSIFSTAYNQTVFHLWLLFFRVTASAFMLTHGAPKFIKVLEGDFTFADPLGVGPAVSLILTVFAEFFCSIFILLGLGTRLAVIPLIITMLVAAFVVHAADPFAKQELPLLYVLIYATLLITGSGKLSIDYFIEKKSSKNKYRF